VNPTKSRAGVTAAVTPPADQARQFSELARSLQAEPDLHQTLRGIVSAAVVNIDAADLAGITLVTKNGALSTPAATDELVTTIDQVQYEVCGRARA
jgi:hypothetical protein